MALLIGACLAGVQLTRQRRLAKAMGTTDAARVTRAGVWATICVRGLWRGAPVAGEKRQGAGREPIYRAIGADATDSAFERLVLSSCCDARCDSCVDAIFVII